MPDRCMTDDKQKLHNMTDTIDVFAKDAFTVGKAYVIQVNSAELNEVYRIQIRRYMVDHQFISNGDVNFDWIDRLAASLRDGIHAIFMSFDKLRTTAYFTVIVDGKPVEITIDSSILKEISGAISAVVTSPLDIFELN